MRYLSADEVKRVNQDELGPDLVMDTSLLESAVGRPQQSAGGADAYPDIHSKAAALLQSLAKNHPFMDGNKRTAVISVGLFYMLNGWWLAASQDELVDLALDVVEDRLPTVESIAERLKELTRSLPGTEE